MTDQKKLWITYAWADNEDGHFDYLIDEIQKVGIPVIYDKIALIPGRRLWDQIGQRINDPEIAAWSYLVTPASLSSRACEEELAYALQRMLESKVEEFPILALVSGVKFENLPPALKVRLGINLDSPNWPDQVKSAVEGKPATPSGAGKNSPYVWQIHENYLGNPNYAAFEIRTKFGSLSPWFIAIPKSGVQPIHWGVGPSGGNQVQSHLMGVESGETTILNERYSYFSAETPMTPSTSVYLVFERCWPTLIRTGKRQGTGYQLNSEVHFQQGK